MATKELRTAKSKLNAVIENTHGAKQFIKAHAEMVIHVENWAVELLPYRVELTAFIMARGKSAVNFNDVVQYGTLFLAASTDFLRGEHIKEEVELTKAEKKELREELTDAFNDDRMKDQLMTKAAAIGWMLYDILLPHVDQDQVEALLTKKLVSIRLNIVCKFVTDKIDEAVTEVKKGAMIAQRLEEAGITINADNTVKCESDKVQQVWDTIQDPNHEDRTDPALGDENAKLEEELKALNTPIAKMVLECHNIISL